MDMANAALAYHFGGYRVDPVRRKVFDPDNKPLKISSRAFDTLLVLIENQGRVLSRRYLIKTVWPNVVVEENNLNQAVSSLRKALKDPKKESRIILNVPGRGYCFVAELEQETEKKPDTGQVSAPALRPLLRPLLARINHLHFYYALLAVTLATATVLFFKVKSDDEIVHSLAREIAENYELSDYAPLDASIAVKPFDHLGDTGRKQAEFSSGLHNQLIQELAGLRGLNIINRDSVIDANRDNPSLRDFGRRLHAETVLTGNLQFVGSKIRISLQLVNPETGVSTWSESLEAEISQTEQNLLLQEKIAADVADSISGEVTRPVQTALVTIF